MLKFIVEWTGTLRGMNRESVEDVILIFLASFLVGVMVVAGYLIVTGLPSFACFLFTVWYVLIV